ncbi:unnamed protein product [Tuber melanosporum]|jgi:hypothetical protein|uniref:(Perigord truffle) hypothetical protein n=1 Tax=Tuber melanosporum (strain Mel28) TaxID=656061 RepID=D5G725_TUBMM|nr:uncharacterized protein GSTUM_00004570001 [Tuber melanosporum]CAZ80318.1 unnamed protein product [Tuber melanosporum]
MKYTLIAIISALSTLASGLAVADQATLLGAIYFPDIAVVIKEDDPNTPFPTNSAQVSRRNGQHTVKTLLGFYLSGFAPGKDCKISFIEPYTSKGSRRMQLFTTIGYPTDNSTWNSKPSTNNHIGTFKASAPGPPRVIEDYGLTFHCPTTPTKYGFEVQPVGDDDYVAWNIRTGGFVIIPQYE